MCDAKSGAFLAEFEGHTTVIRNIQFLPDGHNILSHSDTDNNLRLWDIGDAMQLL